MVTFPSPVQVTLPSYPATITLEIDLSPEGMIATVDIERLASGTFIPTPVNFGNNFIDGKITFEDIAVNKGDMIMATTRVTSIITGDQSVTVDHIINTNPPQTLSATLGTGSAEKFYAEFLFS